MYNHIDNIYFIFFTDISIASMLHQINNNILTYLFIS